MENDAFPRILGLGALGVGLFGSCLEKNPLQNSIFILSSYLFI